MAQLHVFCVCKNAIGWIIRGVSRRGGFGAFAPDEPPFLRKKIIAFINKTITWSSRKAWHLTTTFVIKKEGRRKGEWIAKIMIKSHAFLLDPITFIFF